jgi:hypothetical protein
MKIFNIASYQQFLDLIICIFCLVKHLTYWELKECEKITGTSCFMPCKKKRNIFF